MKKLSTKKILFIIIVATCMFILLDCNNVVHT